MKIEIVNRNLGTDGFARERAESRVRRMLGRFADRVGSVVVTLSALAGRGSGGSREVLVLVQLRRGGQMVVRQRGESPFDLLLRAVRTVRRRIAGS